MKISLKILYFFLYVLAVSSFLPLVLAILPILTFFSVDPMFRFAEKFHPFIEFLIQGVFGALFGFYLGMCGLTTVTVGYWVIMVMCFSYPIVYIFINLL